MVLGYLVLAFRLEPEWMVTLMNLLRQTGKPVAVLDELGEDHVERAVAPLKDDPRFKLFRASATQTAGAAVGRYLAALGHRHVACISAAPTESWSTRRVAGLASVFNELGLPGAVQQFGLPSEDLRPVDTIIPDSLLRPMQDAFVHLQEQLHDPRDRQPVDMMRNLLAAECRRSRLTRLYDRVREEAPEATAWVGTNDAAVLPAIAYLHARKVVVPRDMTLVGMDDTVEASADGLSSFSFSAPAVAEAMLEHVAGYSPARHRGRRVSLVEVPGVVVERTSSGPPGTSVSRT
jgi:DNA-binding LacI/PurR family transcriptional regulator